MGSPAVTRGMFLVGMLQIFGAFKIVTTMAGGDTLPRVSFSIVSRPRARRRRSSTSSSTVGFRRISKKWWIDTQYCLHLLMLSRRLDM